MNKNFLIVFIFIILTFISSCNNSENQNDVILIDDNNKNQSIEDENIDNDFISEPENNPMASDVDIKSFETLEDLKVSLNSMTDEVNKIPYYFVLSNVLDGAKILSINYTNAEFWIDYGLNDFSEEAYQAMPYENSEGITKDEYRTSNTIGLIWERNDINKSLIETAKKSGYKKYDGTEIYYNDVPVSPSDDRILFRLFIFTTDDGSFIVEIPIEYCKDDSILKNLTVTKISLNN